MSRTRQITAIGAVLMLALAAMTGAVSAEAGYYVDESDVSSDSSGTYSKTVTAADNGVIDGATITGLEFNGSASDGADDITVAVEDSNGNVIAKENHTGLDDDATHDLDSSFKVDVAADTEYTLTITSAEGLEWDADSVELDGVAVESTEFNSESVDVAAGGTYEQNVTLLKNERITEVDADNFSVTNITDGNDVNINIKVLDANGNTVANGTQTVTSGNTTDFTQALDMQYASGEEEYTVTISADNADAGFESDTVAINGETPQDGGGSSSTSDVSGTAVVVILVAAGAVLFLAARD